MESCSWPGSQNWEGLQQELAFVFTGTGEHSTSSRGTAFCPRSLSALPSSAKDLRHLLLPYAYFLPARDFLSSLEVGEEPPHQSHDSALEAPPREGLAAKAGPASLPGLPCTLTHSFRDYETFLRLSQAFILDQERVPKQNYHRFQVWV